MPDEAAVATPEEAPIWPELGTSITEQVASVVAHAMEVLETKENVMLWLRDRNTALGRRRPLDLLASGDPQEIQDVDDVLGQIEYGIYS